MARARLHAFIEGEVQMVGFRGFAAERAYALRLTGWVRNTRDGRVEVVAEGEQLDLRTFLDYLRQGPRAARVTGVEEKWDEPTNEYSRFSVKG